MNAIKQIRRYLEADPEGHSAQTLARLVTALVEQKEFPLAELYELDMRAFELAIELLKDWRLDRYYAARVKLFDVATTQVLRSDAVAAAPADLS